MKIAIIYVAISYIALSLFAMYKLTTSIKRLRKELQKSNLATQTCSHGVLIKDIAGWPTSATAICEVCGKNTHYKYGGLIKKNETDTIGFVLKSEKRETSATKSKPIIIGHHVLQEIQTQTVEEGIIRKSP